MGLTDRLRAANDALNGAALAYFASGRRTLTPQQVWGSGGTWQPLSSAGIAVTTERAMQAAVGACVRLLADDISALPADVFRKVDDQSVPVPRPGWLEYPSMRRFETWQMFTSDQLVSLLADGNDFIRCYPNTVTPQFFQVLDPALVTIVERPDGSVVYRYRNTEWTDYEVMHIPWVRLPGKLRGLSVVEASQDSSGLELAARAWAGEFFANGGTVGYVIEHPGNPDDPEKEQLRQAFGVKHTGRGNGWKLGLLTGGAKMTQNALKPAEAELDPLWRHVLEEAARLYHIPPHLLGSQSAGAVSYASVEHRSIEYVQHAIVPITTRLEHAFSRLLPEGQFLKFNVNALLRGDVKTRAEAWSFFLEKKVVTPRYVAGKEDFPPEQAAPGWFESPNNNGPEAAAPSGVPA